ncbi:hypothetical protein F503_06928 [Ophiostoma piceae UAMH 11346]|uniref:Uncharacterized protein n=1 Tax=Ophiostoma piceae (strain UAMH 11346) TaxID=1262450 RepID=S3C8I6_OPHP1|nr:hypothetical protein F503_06928 [Ophiostoma piceae UAMH 11346]
MDSSERAERSRRRPAPWTAEQWTGSIIAHNNGYKSPEIWRPIGLGPDNLFETAEDIQNLLDLDYTPETFESPFSHLPYAFKGNENDIVVNKGVRVPSKVHNNARMNNSHVHYQLALQAVEEPAGYSPSLRNVDIAYYDTTYNGSFLHEAVYRRPVDFLKSADPKARRGVDGAQGIRLEFGRDIFKGHSLSPKPGRGRPRQALRGITPDQWGVSRPGKGAARCTRDHGIFVNRIQDRFPSILSQRAEWNICSCEWMSGVDEASLSSASALEDGRRGMRGPLYRCGQEKPGPATKRLAQQRKPDANGGKRGVIGYCAEIIGLFVILVAAPFAGDVVDEAERGVVGRCRTEVLEVQGMHRAEHGDGLPLLLAQKPPIFLGQAYIVLVFVVRVGEVQARCFAAQRYSVAALSSQSRVEILVPLFSGAAVVGIRIPSQSRALRNACKVREVVGRAVGGGRST